MQSNREWDSTTGADTASSQTAPLGIKIIVVLGLLGSLLSAAQGLVLFQGGSLGAVLGAIVVGLAVAQAYVLIGLLRLEPWAYPWMLLFEGLGVVISLFTLQLIAVLIGVLVIVYIRSKADLYEG